MSKSKLAQPCDSRCCDCRGSIRRRDFVEILGLGAAAALTAGMPVMAGPFEAAEFEKLVPADKKLDPAWVKSLFARGQRTVYRGAELEKIGMPVGGICAGQLYLGGDGTLWQWDVFNQPIGTGDGNYAHPPQPASPLTQGFGLRISAGGKTDFRPLNRKGFAETSFAGEYPIGRVEYRDPATPVAVSLEAFSPFIPLNAEDSSLPATLLRFTVKNTGSAAVEAELIGWLENAVCLYTKQSSRGKRRNRVVHQPGALLLDCSVKASPPAESPKAVPREDILFEDFQKETYEGWTVTGKAFGSGPIVKSEIPSYQGDVGSKGPRVVNSHASAPGANVEEKDRQTGTLTSRPFAIQRDFITFWIGGGDHPGKTCIDLLVDDKVVRSATGHNSNQMRRDGFDVRNLRGKTARLAIVDLETGAWGNIGLAEIVFTDKPLTPALAMEEQPDFGTMVLGLLEPQAGDAAAAAVLPEKIAEARFPGPLQAEESLQEKLVGAVARKLSLAPGQEAAVTFVLAWHFPNLRLKDGGRHYATRFPSAACVAAYLAEHLDRLSRQTRLWHDTWYDSTLPHWFLERTLSNASILATSTCHWFATGRFYGWEGVGCCEGTCTHVWHYAHAVARLFPSLERDLRRRTDFGTAIHRDGIIEHRGESCGLAVDGQAGCILRAYREHQMSAGDAFLKAIWPKVKLAMAALVRMDRGEGLIEGPQHNTLDQPWFGRIAWLSSLYVAAARACEEMAAELGDEAFARQMRGIVQRGGRNIDQLLFNGQYYVQITDKNNSRTVGSHDGCEIDQLFGQSWAYQVGLGRILDAGNVKKALASLWRYNFTPDVGPFRKHYPPGRWYAMPGEAGVLMCSWPSGDKARVTAGFDYYFNECMTGFEYQVAGHMIWEGMVQEGLAVTRAVHDRYHASRRNPWNEVECGDHYARAMASYGVFLAACGYEYHGPKAHLAFAPRIAPEDFRAAFTTADGWGVFRQKRDGRSQQEAVDVRWGKLRLRTLAFTLPERAKPEKVKVALAGKVVPSTYAMEQQRVVVTLGQETIVQAGQSLSVEIA
jgi:non-lysosomal glucosylceramidase